MASSVLIPFPSRRRTERFIQLGGGLVIYGISLALMLSAGLGVDSWDVLHQGLAMRLGVSFGTVVIGVGLLALVAWIPLRQRLGVGTLANAIVIGVAADATLLILDRPGTVAARIAMLLGGVLLNGFATGLYIGAGLGPGPRDGLMTGLARSTGRSLRSVRTLIELTVLVAGWALGGPVGPGTVLYAISIGPLTQHFLQRLTISSDEETTFAAAPPPEGQRRHVPGIETC